MAITRKVSSGYIMQHNTGSAWIYKSGSKWIVCEECTGELFATVKTKKKAINWVIDTFGISERV